MRSFTNFSLVIQLEKRPKKVKRFQLTRFHLQEDQQLANLLEKNTKTMADNEKNDKSSDNLIEDKGVDMMYKLEDTPPWYLAFLLGFQVGEIEVDRSRVLPFKHYI